MGPVPNTSRAAIARSGAGWAWVSFLAALALTAPLIWRAWTLVGPCTYQGGDGKNLQTLLRTFREYAPPLHINIQNPLQAAAGFANPMNVWANPVSWPFFSDNMVFATQASTLIAYGAMATAVFVLTRAWGLPIGASIAGSLSGIVIFPLFSTVFGVSTLITIIPDAAMSAALTIIAASVCYRVNDLGWRSVVGGGLLFALVLAYSVYSEPGWFVGAAFIFAPLFVICLLDARSVPVIAARIAALALAGALLYLVGLVDYVRTLFAYSSRLYFSSEWSRPQDLYSVSWSSVTSRLLWTYLFFLVGWTVGLVFGDRRVRKAALVSVILFAVFLVQAGLFLFAPMQWRPTRPLYYEVLMGPMYALGAIVGYASFFSLLWDKLVPESRRPRFAGLLRALPSLMGMAFVPALGVWYVTQEIHVGRFTPRLIDALTEPWAAPDELAAYLRDGIGLQTAAQFRGRALLRPYYNYPSQHVLAVLWKNHVPTLNMYNTFEMPTFFYFTGHASLPRSHASPARTPDDRVVRRLFWVAGPLDGSDRILKAMGVRYVIHATGDGEKPYPGPADGLLRRQFPPVPVAGEKITHTVYEYADPNVGNYSPTNVVVAGQAAAILHHLWNPSFDPRQSIILPERPAGPIVPATRGAMRFERGAVHVQAESRGRSVLLLPVHYSRCLVLNDAARAKLMPANLVQTALVFQGTVDLRIRFDYGLFRSRCRKEDLADLPRLGIIDEGAARQPWELVHPRAISRLGDLPRAVRGVVDTLAAVP